MFFNVLAEETAIGEMQVIGNLLDTELGSTEKADDLGHGDLHYPVRRQLAATLFAYLGQVLGSDTDLLGKELHFALIGIALQEGHEPPENDIRLTDAGALFKSLRQIEFRIQQMQDLHHRSARNSLQYMVTIIGIRLRYLQLEESVIGLKHPALVIHEMNHRIGTEQLLFLPPVRLHAETLEEYILVYLALGTQEIEREIIGRLHRTDKCMGHDNEQVSRMEFTLLVLHLDFDGTQTAIYQTGGFTQPVIGPAGEILYRAGEIDIINFLCHRYKSKTGLVRLSGLHPQDGIP